MNDDALTWPEAALIPTLLHLVVCAQGGAVERGSELKFLASGRSIGGPNLGPEFDDDSGVYGSLGYLEEGVHEEHVHYQEGAELLECVGGERLGGDYFLECLPVVECDC